MTQDSKLQADVQAELGWDPTVDATHIGVAVQGGVVTLTGHVANFAARHAAGVAALRVRGVAAVAEEIEVRLAFDRKPEDDDLAAAAAERLAWDVQVPTGCVKVVLDHGWLTLTGEVDANYQREAAEQDMRPLAGVRGVTNCITLRAKVDAVNVSDEIMHALHRSWMFDRNDIVVKAVGGRVTLSGTVRTPHERQVAAATAWAAPGTTSVQNDIGLS